MIDRHAYEVLKLCAPLGDTLCIGEPEVNMPGFDRADYILPLIRLGANPISSFDLSNCNLNNLTYKVTSQSDTVYDCGTLEHVARPCVALETYIRHCRVGGQIIIHTTTDGFQKHGFYQFNPELFFGVFSVSNGFSTRIWQHRIGPLARLKEVSEFDIAQTMRMHLPSLIIVATRKVRDVEIKWPIQGIYSEPTPKVGRLGMIGQMVSSFVKSI